MTCSNDRITRRNSIISCSNHVITHRNDIITRIKDIKTNGKDLICRSHDIKMLILHLWLADIGIVYVKSNPSASEI